MYITDAILLKFTPYVHAEIWFNNLKQLKGSVKQLNKFYNMKLRKSLVKPVTRQNISSCLVLPPEIVMHNAFNVIL